MRPGEFYRNRKTACRTGSLLFTRRQITSTFLHPGDSESSQSSPSPCCPFHLLTKSSPAKLSYQASYISLVQVGTGLLIRGQISGTMDSLGVCSGGLSRNRGGKSGLNWIEAIWWKIYPTFIWGHIFCAALKLRFQHRHFVCVSACILLYVSMCSH